MMKSSGSAGISDWPYAMPRVDVRTDTIANRSAANTVGGTTAVIFLSVAVLFLTVSA